MVVTKHSTLPTALSISASLSAADNTENTCTALQRILTVFQAHKLLEVTCQCQAEGQGGQGRAGEGRGPLSGRQTESLNLREEQQVIPVVSAVLEINMERISSHCGNINQDHSPDHQALLSFSS